MGGAEYLATRKADRASAQPAGNSTNGAPAPAPAPQGANNGPAAGNGELANQNGQAVAASGADNQEDIDLFGSGKPAGGGPPAAEGDDGEVAEGDDGEVVEEKPKSRAAKRVQQALWERDQAVARAMELERQLKAGQSQQQQRPPAPQGHPRLAPFDEKINNAQAWLGFAEQHPDGGTVKMADGTERTFAAEDIPKIQARYERELITAQASRDAVASELAEHQKAQIAAGNEEARQIYQWLKFDASKGEEPSPLFVRAKEILQTLPPEINVVMGNHPDGLKWLARMVIGEATERREIARRANGSGRPAANARPPRVVVETPNQAPRGDARAAEAAQIAAAAKTAGGLTGEQWVKMQKAQKAARRT